MNFSVKNILLLRVAFSICLIALTSILMIGCSNEEKGFIDVNFGTIMNEYLYQLDNIYIEDESCDSNPDVEVTGSISITNEMELKELREDEQGRTSDAHDIFSTPIVKSENIAFSAIEAQTFLNRWGCLEGFCEHEGCFTSIHVLDLDKQDNGVAIFGFIIEYSDSLLSEGYRNAYAWVNSDTKTVRFEEAGYSLLTGRNYYANIPDSMIPIPLRDGTIIPYERFFPPGQARGKSYAFSDISIMETYKEQLRNAGFNGTAGLNEYGERIFAPDWVWRYDREEDGATIMVIMYLEERFIMTMSVEFLGG